MIKNKKQMFLVISAFALILFLGGTTYAWFSYRSETSEQELIAGNIYLTLTNGQEEISLTNVFPESKEEARSRDDNYITFEITGINESGKTIYYEFDLNHGTDKLSPNVRFNDEDLRFDLVELDSNNDEVGYLLDAVSYNSLVNQRIYIDTVDVATDTEIERHYKLRMWLSDDVIVSDTDSNATYPATGFNNYYANIKLSVIGDFTERLYGYQKVQKAILAKQNADTNSCNPTWTDTDDGIIYFSGTNDCIDMNYVWYSGKLWRITAIYPDGAMKLVTQNNITSIAFNESTIDFYTNANTTSYMYQWLNEDFYDTLYHASQFIDTSKQWNATRPAATEINNKPGNTNMVTANVGLLNSYDFYNSYRCINSDTCEASVNDSLTSYLKIDFYWWLLNPYNSNEPYSVSSYGYWSGYSMTNSYGVRPSIVLKSKLDFTGEGTIDSPYKIVGDKKVGSTNELIKTRLSGEYVKLDNGTTNQLFRIIGVEDNKTKIIAMDYANNKNVRLFSTNNSDTIWGRGTTAGTNTWYTYLNTQTTGYFDTLKSTYGELFDSGLYYLGTSGYNYKLSVCANTTSGNSKVCDKTSDKGMFNIGLPRYGEMFSTLQGDSTTMWLMNRMNTTYVWYAYSYGVYSNSPANVTGGARPTVHLKSTVKILSGSGTETDPYVVGL